MKLDLKDTAGIKLLAELSDAERCWAIYRNPVAVQRPVAAWTILPLGNGVREPLLRLMDEPAEDVPPDIYQTYLARLHVRLEQARAAWQAYLAHKEGRPNVAH